MRDNGSPEPQFETNEERTHFLVRLPLRTAPQATPQEEKQPTLLTPITSDVSHTNTPQATPQAQDTLLAFCASPRSATEIRRKLGLKDAKHFRTNYLEPALTAGLLEMTLPDKPRSPKQRYITTESGRRQLSTRT